MSGHDPSCEEQLECNSKGAELPQQIGTGTRGFPQERGDTSPPQSSKRKCEVADMTEDTIQKKTSLDNEAKMGCSSNQNQDTGKEEETSVEQSVFSNHLVLSNILKFFTLQELKLYRAVNRLWNVEATKIIYNKRTIKPIRVLTDAVELEKGADQTDLKEFTNLVEHSEMFPCNSFVIVGHEWNDERANFFRLNGSVVKSVLFHPRTSKNSQILGLAVVLFEGNFLPNLEILSFTLKFISMIEAEFQTLSQTVELRKLHTLNISYNFPVQVLSSLIPACVNLKNIYCDCNSGDDDSNYYGILNALSHLKVMHLLQNVCVFVEDESIETYNQLVQQRLCFKQIHEIDVNRPFQTDLSQVGRILTKFFHGCSTTVTKIFGLWTMGHIPGLEIPIFPNVVKMVVLQPGAYDEERPLPSRPVSPLFPLGVSLAEKFPKLRELKLRDFSCEIFPLNDIRREPLIPLLSLRFLIVNYYAEQYNAPWMKHFTDLFPNVACASFRRISIPDLENIWGFRCLKKLRIVFGYDAWGNTPFETMDSTFTGFSVESVLDLYGRSPADLNLSHSEVDSLRIKPSVTDLKHLRQITIRFGKHSAPNRFKPVDVNVSESCDSGAYLKVMDRIVLSRVTKLFGFSMCPRLQLRFDT